MTLDDISFNMTNIMKILDSCELLEKLDEVREYEFNDETYDSIMYTDVVNGMCYELVEDAELISVSFGEDSTYYSSFDDNHFVVQLLSGCMQRNKEYLANIDSNKKAIADILGVQVSKRYQY